MEIKPSSLEEFNRRMSAITTGHIRHDRKGKYQLYVELNGITQWCSTHDSLDSARDAAANIGCGKAIVYYCVDYD